MSFVTIDVNISVSIRANDFKYYYKDKKTKLSNVNIKKEISLKRVWYFILLFPDNYDYGESPMSF